jgi:hypothetical protein
MAFDWLEGFHHAMPKDAAYAERTLASYRLGMKAKGAIVGVAIQTDAGCCDAARALEPGAVYDPATAPRLPLAACPRAGGCTCVYRPVMSYQRVDEP